MPSPRRGKSHDRMRTHALAAPTTLSPREYGPGRWLRPWLRSCPGSFLVGDGVSNARPTSLHTGGAEVDSQDGDHVDGIHCDPVVQYVVWNMYGTVARAFRILLLLRTDARDATRESERNWSAFYDLERLRPSSTYGYIATHAHFLPPLGPPLRSLIFIALRFVDCHRLGREDP